MFKRCLFFILLAITPTTWALDDDQYQPLHVTSDEATYDRDKRTITYIGHVEAKQGSAHLDANKVIVYQLEGNGIKQVIAYGKPAHYNTMPSAGKERIYVESDKITYDPNQKTVLLEDHGKVKQEGDLFTGPYIWYDISKGVVRSKTVKPGQRTTVTIQPK